MCLVIATLVGILSVIETTAGSLDNNIELKNEIFRHNSSALQDKTDAKRRLESRTINLLRNIWNKPKVSPLYLLDGTVCRFVNYQPICTTLSTTGINRK